MRSYFKLYTDNISSPRYFTDQPANDTDVAIALKRVKKASFITALNAFMPATLESLYPGARHWVVVDSAGNRLGGDTDFVTVVTAGFNWVSYDQHPLD